MANRYCNLVGSKKISEDFNNINTGFDQVQAEMDTKSQGDHRHSNATHQADGYMSASDKIKLDASTSALVPGAIARRDASGRLMAAAPSTPSEVARKAEVDAVQADLDRHKSSADIHVTKANKVEWDSKAPGSTLAGLNKHKADTNIHVTAQDHKKLDGIEARAEVNQNAFAKVNDIPAKTKTDTLNFKGGVGIKVTTNPGTNDVTVTATGKSTPGAHGSSHTEYGSDPIPDLVKVAGKPLKLEPGIQTVKSEQDAPFRMGEIKGRTIIPLLSPELLEFKDSTGEGVADGWYWQLTDREGKYSMEDGYQKIESLATDKSYGNRWICTPPLKVEAGRRYVAVVDAVTDGASEACIGLYLGESSFDEYTSGTYIKGIATVDADDAKLYVYNCNDAGKVGWVKFRGIGLYEVSEELYNAIGTTITEDNIRQYLPHTKTLTNVTNPYAIVTGSNQQRSMIAFEAELAANPVDGSDPDTLFMGDDGLPYVKELWEKVVLDGSQKWVLIASYTGFKQVGNGTFPVTGHQGLVTKYDGKLLQNFVGKPPAADMGTISQNNGALHITIANKDSGWGPDYTPTPDEIKLYFMGWRMTTQETWNTAHPEPYNGTGTKGWTAIYSGVGTQFKDSGFVTGSGQHSPPSTVNPYGYTPYRLQYLKVKSTIEPVRNYELGATLTAGSNKVEVGSGIVLRERANPVFNKINHWFINRDNAGYSQLKHKASKINNVYKNGRIDSAWAWSDMPPYGKDIRAIADSFYDPTATYHVTYTMLDPTLVAPISGTVAANLRGTVSDLVQDVGDVQQRLSVAEAITSESIGAETPSGAQAKANQAEANAKAHANNELAKVKQRHQLTRNGGTTIRPSDKNLNNLTTTGFYSGSFDNAPTTNWANVEVFADDDMDVMQRLYDMRGDKTYTRRHVSGDNWTPWLLVLDGKDYNELKTHANTAANQAETNAKNASLPINGAANKQGQLTVTQNADAVNLMGTDHVYQRFLVGGEPRGYVGPSNPAQPNNMYLVSQKGSLELHGSGGAVLLNGRNVLSELDQVKQSGVNAKQGLVDALNAIGIAASTNDNWATLNAKVRQANYIRSAIVSSTYSDSPTAPYYKNFFDMPAGTTKFFYTTSGSTHINGIGTTKTIALWDAFGGRIELARSDPDEGIELIGAQIDLKSTTSRATFQRGDESRSYARDVKGSLNPAGGISFGAFIFGSGHEVSMSFKGLVQYA